MTDEEMAKEYAVGRTYPKFETDYIANFVLREVEGTFLAGLNAGRPKWHKVADGDLPKNEGWVCNQDGLPCWYDWNTEQWFACGGVPIRTIAWCETPHIPTEEVEV